MERNMYLLEQDIQAIRAQIKHLPGRHNQMTHGNRFSMIAGQRLQTRIGGKRGVIQYDAHGNPLSHGPVVPPPKKPKAPPKPKLTTAQKNKITQGAAMSADDLVVKFGDAYAKNPDAFATHTSGGDALLGAVLEHQGFNGKPDVVSPDEMDAYVTTGKEKQGYRGFDDGNGYDTAFMSGKNYPGYGIYGNGTYVAMQKGSDASGAKTEAGGYAVAHGTDGAVLRLSLKKGANIGKYTDLQTEMNNEWRQVQSKLRTVRASMNATPFSDPSYASLKRQESDLKLQESVYSNVGRYAASKGLDGYKVNQSHNGSGRTAYHVILNRTALRVSTQVHHKTAGWNSKWID